MLVLKEELSRCIEGENAAVESRVDRIEELCREGEEGHELNVGVVFGVIGDHCWSEGRKISLRPSRILRENAQ